MTGRRHTGEHIKVHRAQVLAGGAVESALVMVEESHVQRVLRPMALADVGAGIFEGRDV